jgi:hypothetical protein
LLSLLIRLLMCRGLMSAVLVLLGSGPSARLAG